VIDESDDQDICSEYSTPPLGGVPPSSQISQIDVPKDSIWNGPRGRRSENARRAVRSAPFDPRVCVS
jgi:hypothetical protein